MRNAIIVDDEEPALHVLNKLITQCTDLHIQGMYSNPHEALANIMLLHPDVVFIDIDMPSMNGLELAGRLIEWNFALEIVFVTAYSEFALQAFKVNALDYLLKPVSPKDIIACWKKLNKRLQITESPIIKQGSKTICFGGFQVYEGNQIDPLRFPTKKVEELFAYLIMHRRVYSTKWTICEHLWPNWHPDKAEQNLHTSIFRLKKTLSEHGIRHGLESHRSSYKLILHESCDYIRFDDALPESLSILAEEPYNNKALETLIGLYKGPLFEGKEYEWCLSVSEQLRRKFTLWTLYLSRALIHKQACLRAIHLLRLLLLQSPYEEEGHRLLLLAFLALGDRASFLDHYEKFRLLFLRDLGLKLSHEVEQLYQSVIE